MDLEGWYPDPFGIHEERLFQQGKPTPLVRDGGIGSVDYPPPAHDARRHAGEADVAGLSVHTRTFPVRKVVTGALALVTIGVVIELVGLTGSGAPKPSATANVPASTSSTMNPFVRWRLSLPANTTLTSIEAALEALPRAAPVTTTSPPSPSSTSSTSSSSTSTTKLATRPRPTTTTQPVKPVKAPAPTTTPGSTTTAHPTTTAPTTSTPAATSTSSSSTSSSTTSSPATTTSAPGTSTTTTTVNLATTSTTS